MSLASAGSLLGEAVERECAVPAFNVITLEQAEAIVAGASEAGVGVLLQLSENAINYHGMAEAMLAACREIAVAAPIPVGLHLDHIQDDVLVRRLLPRASELGVGSVMFDASTLSYEENVSTTADIVAISHDEGLWVEAELGEIGGKDGAHAPGVRTDPDEAAAFVAATRVDGLAVAVGSSHAMRERSASIDIDLVERLARRLPVPLVLHGSSGVPDDTIRRAVKAGIRKVNIGTALNIAAGAALRSSLAERPDAFDPRIYSRQPFEATAELVTHLCTVIATR